MLFIYVLLLPFGDDVLYTNDVARSFCSHFHLFTISSKKWSPHAAIAKTFISPQWCCFPNKGHPILKHTHKVESIYPLRFSIIIISGAS